MVQAKIKDLWFLAEREFRALSRKLAVVLACTLAVPVGHAAAQSNGLGGNFSSGGQRSSSSDQGTGSGGTRRVQTDPDYALSSGDLIVVEMYEHADIRTSQRLTATGEIRLPLVGRVTLLNRSVREAEHLIEALYKDGGFYVDPQVILFVEQYVERFVAVFGQVNRPDRIPFPAESNSLGILQAVTLAGGFTRIARTDSVQVSRTNANGIEERFEVDVRDLLTGRSSNGRREFQLQSGDVVFVRERTI